jgi:hypothetical protein
MSNAFAGGMEDFFEFEWDDFERCTDAFVVLNRKRSEQMIASLNGPGRRMAMGRELGVWQHHRDNLPAIGVAVIQRLSQAKLCLFRARQAMSLQCPMHEHAPRDVV